MTPHTPTLRIASDALSAEIAPLGAELQSLCDAEGNPLQWDGDPAVWAGRAPILFPIVGMLEGERYRYAGRSYALPKHGFARRSTFDVVSHDDGGATLRLSPSAGTRAAYPFEFQLDVAYRLAGAELTIVATVANHGDDAMPASLGFHPALRWPLPYGKPRADHRIRFEYDEPGPIRRIDADGHLTPDALPTPVVGDVLALSDALFVDDAVIFDRLKSRKVAYGAATGPTIEFRFDDFPMLGVWTKVGGGFICIEPWQGIADPVGFDGDITTKPGIVMIAPGQSRAWTMSIALTGGPLR